MANRELSEFDWNRVFALRCRAKMGQSLLMSESQLIQRAMRQDRLRFEAMSAAVSKVAGPHHQAGDGHFPETPKALAPDSRQMSRKADLPDLPQAHPMGAPSEQVHPVLVFDNQGDYTPESMERLLFGQGYGGDRGRPYDGLTVRDVGDCIARGAACVGEELNYAIIQSSLCEVEKLMGTFPNIPSGTVAIPMLMLPSEEAPCSEQTPLSVDPKKNPPSA